jgi:hypothetical protein
MVILYTVWDIYNMIISINMLVITNRNAVDQEN